MHQCSTLGFCSFAALLLLAAGCNAQPQEVPGRALGTPLRIAILSTLSGPERARGSDIVAGFDLYLTSNNARIGGRQTEVRVEDDKRDANVGTDAVHRLIDNEQVDVILGMLNPGVCWGVAEYVKVVPSNKRANVPVLATSCNLPDPPTYQSLSSPYFYRLKSTPQRYSRFAAEWSHEQSYTRTLVLTSNIPTFGGINLTLQDAGDIGLSLPGLLKTQGIQVLNTLRLPSNNDDFDAVLDEISGQTEAVLAALPPAGMRTLLRQYVSAVKPLPPLIELGFSPVPFGDPTNPAQVFAINSYGESLANPSNVRFLELAKRQSSTAISEELVEGYVAGEILDAALRSLVGTVTRTRLVEALSSVQSDTLLGPVSFDSNRIRRSNTYVFQLLNGAQPLLRSYPPNA